MICTEVAGMKRILFKIVLPVSLLAAWMITCYPICRKAEGFDSNIFALALIFALVVMYDAAGVRRAAGKQAKLLNRIIETPGLTNVQVQEKLVEVLGHTPIQVFVGAFLGIIVGLFA